MARNGIGRGHQMTTKEAGEKLGLSRQAITQWILRGWLPATKFGNQWMITEKDLLAAHQRSLKESRMRRAWISRKAHRSAA
jgi:excisionase family DNA binding protein